MGFGFELAGRNATWTFENDSLVINYSSSRGVPRLLRRIGTRTVPFEAISSAGIMHGDGPPVLAVRLRSGADPYTEAAASQLPEDSELYRLELDPDQAELGSYHADHLRLQVDMHGLADQPTEEFLLSAEEPPLQLRGWDGDGHLDEHGVRFRWNSEATYTKRQHGDRTYRMAELSGVEWARPGMMSGHLSVKLAEGGDWSGSLEDDPSTILFGLGCGTVADSLSFAASLLVGIQRHKQERAALTSGAALPAGEVNKKATPSEIVEAIRALDELLRMGLITEDEFDQKKKELLARI